MTVITYKDGVVAADSLATAHDGNLRTGLVDKLAQGPSGEVLACLGCSLQAQRLRRWYLGGKKGKQPGGDDGDLIVIHSGGVERYHAGDVEPHAVADYYAWGVGRELAMGAMAAGADAVRAAEIAILHSVYCGGPVKHLEVTCG